MVDVGDEPDPRHPGALLVPPAELPDEVPGFTLPSRYVESDLPPAALSAATRRSSSV